MQISFDAQSNVVYARFTVHPVERSVRLDENTLVDVDLSGDLVGIEAVLGRGEGAVRAMRRYGVRDEDAEQLCRLLDGSLDIGQELARSRQQWHPEQPAQPASGADLPRRVPGAGGGGDRPSRPGTHRSPWVRL